MIRLEELHIRLPEFVLENICLDIPSGEFFVLMGPTGSGKTLMLEAIAGLMKINRGRIFIDGKEVTRQPPEKRGIGIVYQDQALFPHLSVAKNISYGIRYHRVRTGALRRHVDGLVSLLGLEHLLDRLPGHLSGGEKQRVALARALAVRPDVLLLDEPLSALDPNFRDEVRQALKALHAGTGATFLMVSHDFSEALSLADRAAVINNGRIEQVGCVDDIFHRPSSAFVADFVGMKNIFAVHFNENRATLDNLEIRLKEKPELARSYLAIRPEDITIGAEGESGNGQNAFQGKVVGILNRGFTYEVHLRVDTTVFKSLVTKRDLVRMALHEGQRVSLAFAADAVHTF